MGRRTGEGDGRAAALVKRTAGKSADGHRTVNPAPVQRPLPDLSRDNGDHEDMQAKAALG